MPPVKMRGDGRKAKNPKKTFLRLLSYMKRYIPSLILVMLCIVIAAFAQTTSSKSIGTLVDDYISLWWIPALWTLVPLPGIL